MKYKLKITNMFKGKQISFTDLDFSAVYRFNISDSDDFIKFFAPDGSLVRHNCSSLDSAIDYFVGYLVSNCDYVLSDFSFNAHGGKRTGAGRKGSPVKTKPMRLTESEIELIKVLRSKSDDINFDLVLNHAKEAENNLAYF